MGPHFHDRGVPLASADVPFVFPETTADFQSVTIQGQLTYRVADSKRLASLLDFTIDKRNTSYFADQSRDRQKLEPSRELVARQERRKNQGLKLIGRTKFWRGCASG